MQVLSISVDELIFILFSLGIIGFTTCAVISKNTRSSLIHLLFACLIGCGFIALISDAIIASVLAIIYTSFFSLLLTMTPDEDHMRSRIDKLVSLTILLMFIISLLIYKHSSVQLISERGNSHYAGVAEITLITSLVFIFVLSGIIALKEKK